MNHAPILPSLLLILASTAAFSQAVTPHGRPGGASGNPETIARRPEPRVVLTDAVPDRRDDHRRWTAEGAGNPDASRRRTGEVRVIPANVDSGRGTSKPAPIVLPPATPRFLHMPTLDDWRNRDIMKSIIGIARMGSIPVKPLGTEASVMDHAWIPAGWQAYGLVVPPKGTVKVTLNHHKEGWFRVHACNQWGALEAGMLQNVTRVPSAYATYANPTNKPRAVYFVVDDPGWWSSKEDPFTLKIERSWSAEEFKSELPLVQGIWAIHLPDASQGSPGKLASAW